MADPPPPGFEPQRLLDTLKEGWRSILDGVQWVQDHQADIRAWAREVGQRGGAEDPWRWLFDRVSAFTSLTMKGGLELERRLVADKPRRGMSLTLLVDEAVDRSLITAVREVLARAPLRGHQPEQLDVALGFVDDGRDYLAVPLLINTFEGILWFEVANQRLIERNSKGKWEQTALAPHQGDLVHGVEAALDLLASSRDDDFRDFLKAVVYGGPGDPFRHGTPSGEWQLRANFLVFALIGWLDMHGLLDSRAVIFDAFRRAQDRRDAASGADESHSERDAD